MKDKKFTRFVFIGVMLFFYLPLLTLVVYSFNSGKNLDWEGFSLKWYHELFYKSADLWHSVENSLIVALVSALIATIIGTLGALSIHWHNFKLKKYLEVTTYLPLVLPDIIMGVSLLMFFVSIKLKLSLITIILAHITFNIPFVVFLILSRLKDFDESTVEVAFDLGAKERQVFFKVLLPQLMPGILASLLLSVTLSLDDFIIAFFVSGLDSATLSIHVNSMVKFGVTPVINALSTLMIGFIFISVFTTKKFQQKNLIKS